MAVLKELVLRDIQRKQYSYRDVGRISGLSHVTISRIATGFTEQPAQDILIRLARALGASPRDYLEAAGYIVEDLGDQGHTERSDVIPRREMTRLPILGEVRGGMPIIRHEYIEGYEEIDVNLVRGGDYFYLRVKGDSMNGDGIIDGSLVRVRRQEVIQSGEIALVALNGDEATVKRVWLQDEEITLEASNPEYMPRKQHYHPRDVQIIGKIVASLTYFNE